MNLSTKDIEASSKRNNGLSRRSMGLGRKSNMCIYASARETGVSPRDTGRDLSKRNMGLRKSKLYGHWHEKQISSGFLASRQKKQRLYKKKHRGSL